MFYRYSRLFSDKTDGWNLFSTMSTLTRYGILVKQLSNNCISLTIRVLHNFQKNPSGTSGTQTRQEDAFFKLLLRQFSSFRIYFPRLSLSLCLSLSLSLSLCVSLCLSVSLSLSFIQFRLLFICPSIFHFILSVSPL